MELTLKQILDSINKELDENFNKPVIMKESSGYWNSGYDTENGRKLISDINFKNILSRYGINTYYCDKRYCVYGVDIKVKKKRSGIKDSWNGTERMTIVNAYCEDIDALEMTLSQLKQREENERNAEAEEHNQQQTECKDMIINTLKNAGINFRTFENLMYAYKELNYDLRKEVERELK